MVERMDFDIGTLIYIIATLVAVIAGAFSKKKKPAGGQQPEGSERKEGSGGFFGKLEQQFEGIVDEARNVVKETTGEFTSSEDALEEMQHDEYTFAEEVHEKRLSGENEKIAAFSQYEGIFDPDMLMNQELIEGEAERSTGIQVIELEEDSYVDYYEIVKDFDLGTAVVYSAIISRPDY